MDKGNLLASANGEGHSAITKWWVIEIIGAVMCVVLGYWLADKYGYSIKGWFSNAHTVKNAAYNFLMGGGIVCGALCLYCAYLTGSRIGKTTVNVYENIIEGLSTVPNFPLSFMLYGSISSLQLADFQLKYDQVSSVDVVDENSLVINAINVKHKIFIMNAREIRDIILSQKNVLSQDTKQVPGETK